MQFDENAKASVTTMTKWAMVIVITSLVGFVLDIINYFKQKSEFDTISETQDIEGGSSLVNTITTTGLIVIIVSILVGLLITYFLYQFAVKTKKGIDTLSPYEVNVGFTNFKNYFVVFGILFIIAIVFVGFGLIAVLIFSS